MAQIFVGSEDAGIIDDNIVGVQKTYSSSKIEARLGTKAGKAIGSSGKILIGDSEGNPVASTVTPADFALAEHNHDSTSIVLSTTNFGGVLNGSIDTVQELADFIDDNIGFGSKILIGTGIPSGVIGNKGDIYISNLGQIYLKDTGGNWQDTGVNISGSDGVDGDDGVDGADGREVEITADATNIKWRYVGDVSWNNIVALSSLVGNDGADGRDAEFRVVGQDLQYRLVGDFTWNTIYTFPTTAVSWADISGKPTEFTPTSHSHSIGDITGLSSILSMIPVKNLFIQTTIPTVTEPSLWIDTTGGNFQFNLVTP